MNVEELKQKEVFRWFYEISQIPRETFNEGEISDWLVNFAQNRHLEVKKDDYNNVIIKKPASPGYENAKTISLQAHMDMVAVKESTSNHNFKEDPIEWMIKEDGWLSAKDTTLGADNGIGVAIILEILSDENVNHGPINAIFTACEEQGMVGASKINLEELKTDYLINLDAEDEDYIVIGCIGAEDFEMDIPKKLEDSYDDFIKIEFADFKGGHSGAAVLYYVMNTIKSLARMISGLDSYKICEIKGGHGLKNAVPSSAYAIISVPDKKVAMEKLNEVKNQILNEYKLIDSDGNITIKDSNPFEKSMDYESSKNLVELIQVFPDGVYKTFNNMLVTSSNLGILEDEKDHIHAVSMLRSDYRSELDYRIGLMKMIAEKYKASYYTSNKIPGWERETDELVNIAKSLGEKTYGHPVKLVTAHGTLEPSFLKKQVENVPMISIGPKMTAVHSPKEKVNILSVDKFYNYLKKLLVEVAN